MKFSKCCGLAIALLCAHVAVASSSELAGEPQASVATQLSQTRLRRFDKVQRVSVERGYHQAGTSAVDAPKNPRGLEKLSKDARSKVDPVAERNAAQDVADTTRAHNKAQASKKNALAEHKNAVEEAAAAGHVAKSAQMAVEAMSDEESPSGSPSQTVKVVTEAGGNQSSSAKSLAAAYAKEPSTANLEKLNRATQTQIAGEQAVAAGIKATEAKKLAKAEKQDDKLKRQVVREDSRKAKRTKAKVEELKSVLQDLNDPAQKKKFSGKLEAAEKTLSERQGKLDDAQDDKKIADIKVTAAKDRAQLTKKAAAALMSLPKAKSMAAAAQKELAHVQKQQADANRNAEQGKMEKEFDAVKNPQQGEKLLKKLKLERVRTKLAMKKQDGKTSPAEKAAAGQVMMSIKRVKEKLEGFKTAEQTQVAKKKIEQADRKLEKLAKSTDESDKEEKELLVAKKNEKKVEQKLVKEAHKLKKQEQRKAGQLKAQAEEKLDGAIKVEVAAERDALKKAKASGNAKEEMKMLKQIEKTDIQQKLKEEKRTKKKESNDVDEAKKDLQQAKKEYTKEKALADEKIAQESKGSLAGPDQIEAEVSKLEREASNMEDNKSLDKMTSVSFAYRKMKGASRAIESGLKAMNTVAKREIVDMANASKQVAQHVLDQLAGKNNHSGIESMHRMASMTQLGESITKQNLARSKESYNAAFSKFSNTRKLRQQTGGSSLQVTALERKEAEEASTVRHLRTKMQNNAIQDSKTAKSTEQVKLALQAMQVVQGHLPTHDSKETKVAKKVSRLLKNAIGAIKAGKFDNAKQTVAELKKTKATKLSAPAHVDAFMHLQGQVHELGEIETNADSIASKAVQQSYAKDFVTKPAQPTSKTKAIKRSPRSFPLSPALVANNEQIVGKGAEKAVHEAVAMNKKEVAKERQVLADQNRKLEAAQEKLLPLEAKVAEHREESVSALESLLAGQEKQVRIAKKAVATATEVVERYTRVIEALSQEAKMSTEQSEADQKVQDSVSIDSAKAKMAESLLGKQAGKTLLKLQSAEKQSERLLLKSNNVSLASNNGKQSAADIIQQQSVQTMKTIQETKAQLAEQLMDLREAAENKTSIMNQADKAKVAALKNEFSSPKEQLAAAKTALRKANLARTNAKAEYKGAKSVVKATTEHLQAVKAGKIVEMISVAKGTKKSAAEHEARNKAKQATVVSLLDTKRMKNQEAAAATVLALKLEQDKAEQYTNKAQATSQRAEALREKADNLQQEANKMEKQTKEKVESEKASAKIKEKVVIQESEAKIQKAKSGAKAAQSVVEKLESEKKDLSKQNSTNTGLSSELHSLEKKEKAAANNAQTLNIARAEAGKAFSDMMRKYTLHALKPQSKDEEDKLRKELKLVSPTHADKFSSRYGPESLLVQVAAAKKHVADLKYKKAQALHKSAKGAVTAMQQKLNKATTIVAKAEIANAREEKKEIKKAEKLQKKVVKEEKRDYSKISSAQKEEQAVKASTRITPASLIRIQGQAQAALKAAAQAQSLAKKQSAAALDATAALHKTLEQSLQEEHEVALSSEKALNKEITEVKKGESHPSNDDDTLSTLGEIRLKAQQSVKQVASMISVHQEQVNQKLKNSEAMVNSASKSVLQMEASNGMS